MLLTIFRVNTDRDDPVVVKKLKEKDPTLSKCMWEWAGISLKLHDIFKKQGGPLLKASRKMYALSDKRLKLLAKDKQADKKEIEMLMKHRKRAYDMGLFIKEHMKDPY